MNRIAILDNTVLSNFALVKRPDLVNSFWPGLACTTPTALGEYLSASDKIAFPVEYWSELPVLELSEQEEQLARQFSARLGAGERSCIAVAILRQGLFVSDDLDARRIARDRNVLLSGTLGILIGCVQRNLLTMAQANRLLGIMIAAGYRSPVSELK